MISIDKVSLQYRQRKALLEAVADVSLNVEFGETCVLIGPSGCGKSSLLYMVAGLIKPNDGTIKINNEIISGQRSKTALILQEYGLFPWKNVKENIELGLKLRKISHNDIEEIVLPIINKLGLTEYLHHYPTQLSGGQRQRVAIARALALNPDLLLMDEPFSSLDALTREELQQLILQLWNKHSVTMLMVTHNIEEAVYIGQKIVVLSRRPAQIIEIIDNPLGGTENYRSSAEFYQKCSRIRELLEVSHRGEK